MNIKIFTKGKQEKYFIDGYRDEGIRTIIIDGDTVKIYREKMITCEEYTILSKVEDDGVIDIEVK